MLLTSNRKAHCFFLCFSIEYFFFIFLLNFRYFLSYWLNTDDLSILCWNINSLFLSHSFFLSLPFFLFLLSLFLNGWQWSNQTLIITLVKLWLCQFCLFYKLLIMKQLIVPIINDVIQTNDKWWPSIHFTTAQYKCILTYHWIFVLYDVIFFIDTLSCLVDFSVN